MKKFSLLLLPLVILLSGCSGSDAYQGDWKATNPKGKKFQMNFEPKSFTVERNDSIIATFSYSQNSISIENGVTTYGIKLNNGRQYNITFPISGDKTKGVITMENEQPIYIISRTSYLDYKDVYKQAE